MAITKTQFETYLNKKMQKKFKNKNSYDLPRIKWFCEALDNLIQQDNATDKILNLLDIKHSYHLYAEENPEVLLRYLSKKMQGLSIFLNTKAANYRHEMIVNHRINEAYYNRVPIAASGVFGIGVTAGVGLLVFGLVLGGPSILILFAIVSIFVGVFAACLGICLKGKAAPFKASADRLTDHPQRDPGYNKIKSTADKLSHTAEGLKTHADLMVAEDPPSKKAPYQGRSGRFYRSSYSSPEETTPLLTERTRATLNTPG